MDAKKMKNNYTYSRYVYINIIYIYISDLAIPINIILDPLDPLIRPPANRPKIAGGASRRAARAPPSAGSQTDAAAGKAVYQPVAPSSTAACSEGGPSTGSPLSGVPGSKLRPGTAVGARNQNEESFFRKRQLASSM